MSDAFTKVWLRTDTYIDNLSPGQRRQLRALCEKFFRAGQQVKEHRQDSRAIINSNQSCNGESDAGSQG